MKKSILASILASFILFSCQSKGVQQEEKKTEVAQNSTKTFKDEHNSRNSLDWDGKYEGTLPCADCEGIKYIVEIKKDGNFFIEQEYLGKETVYQDEGFYKWDATGNILHLNSNISPLVLKVEENRLKVLDQEGKEITGNLKDLYVLKKVKK
ncbi:copper resistance protein NlpE [Empedobacter stercoris]|uniref:copper resistance protein NlpE n=1 Tax=Empedobacter stercoris TaxID=1628248 RepID=UPI001CE04897|nr:copper resistance protein NlpE [Empedobacter stercoris]MCA4775806.1 copper resistance protein NlpE N-terminal domain-containing protein [Empedobacter stercoris]